MIVAGSAATTPSTKIASSCRIFAGRLGPSLPNRPAKVAVARTANHINDRVSAGAPVCRSARRNTPSACQGSTREPTLRWDSRQTASWSTAASALRPALSSNQRTGLGIEAKSVRKSERMMKNSHSPSHTSGFVNRQSFWSTWATCNVVRNIHPSFITRRSPGPVFRWWFNRRRRRGDAATPSRSRVGPRRDPSA